MDISNYNIINNGSRSRPSERSRHIQSSLENNFKSNVQVEEIQGDEEERWNCGCILVVVFAGILVGVLFLSFMCIFFNGFDHCKSKLFGSTCTSSVEQCDETNWANVTNHAEILQKSGTMCQPRNCKSSLYGYFNYHCSCIFDPSFLLLSGIESWCIEGSDGSVEIKVDRPIHLNKIEIGHTCVEDTCGPCSGENSVKRFKIIARNAKYEYIYSWYIDAKKSESWGSPELQSFTLEFNKELKSIDPTQVQFIEIHIHDNWGGSETRLSQIKIFGNPQPIATILN